jgi:hypothetical protein
MDNLRGMEHGCDGFYGSTRILKLVWDEIRKIRFIRFIRVSLCILVQGVGVCEHILLPPLEYR